MTYQSIVELFETQTTLWNLLFKQFEYISPGEYSRDTNLLYPLVSFERCLFGSFTTEETTYKISLIFSDRSIEGLENEISILSNLINSTQIYMIDFGNRYIDIGVSNVTFLTDQESGNDRAYKVKVEFDLTVMNPSCEELLLNYTPTDCTLAPVCNVVLDTVTAFDFRNLFTIQTTFTSITGIDFFEVYLRDSISAYSMIYIDNTPQLINVFGVSSPPPESYFVQIIWYDLCGNQGEQEFGPFIVV